MPIKKNKKSAWAQVILRKHWDALARVARSSDRMPVRGARGDVLFHGCGSYGCVAPCADSSIVLKITSDPDEAGFVEASLRTTRAPTGGMVRYDAIAELPERRQTRPVYAIWREEAFQVGVLPWWEYERECSLLDCFDVAADVLRASVRRVKSRDAFVHAAREVLRDNGLPEELEGVSRGDRMADELSAWRGVEKAAYAMGVCREYGRDMADSKWPLVGRELTRWLEDRILLCDVHRGNVGVALRDGRDEVVITDPGHALLLDDSHATVRVPTLEEAALLGWRSGSRRSNPPRTPVPQGRVSKTRGAGGPVRLVKLPAGTTLYHGTSAEEADWLMQHGGFHEPERASSGQTWFSFKPKIAWEYAVQKSPEAMVAVDASGLLAAIAPGHERREPWYEDGMTYEEAMALKPALVVYDRHELDYVELGPGKRLPVRRLRVVTSWQEENTRSNPHDPNEAWLRAMFERERRRFKKTYPSVTHAELIVSDEACNHRGACRKRDVAFCGWTPTDDPHVKRNQVVVILRRALPFSKSNLVAIVRHELGHLCDARAGDADGGAEARADRIAEEVGGEHLSYDRDDLQTVGRGNPIRPSYLHQ